MNYIAILDYEHLDNNLFLRAFAQSVSRQKNVHGIILHGDSAYTDRILQTGVMRDEARLRSTRDLNKRLINLLADSGVAAIGINGYQKEAICYDPGSDKLSIDKRFFESLPGPAFLVLSNLVYDTHTRTPRPFPLIELANKLQKELNHEKLFAFKIEENDGIIIENKLPNELQWSLLDEETKKNILPVEIRNTPCSFYLSTARSFMYLPDIKEITKISFDN